RLRPGRVAAAVSFFFLQAEDGIRDATVTGVQTCALPISSVFKFIVTRFPFGFLQKARRLNLKTEALVYPSVDPTTEYRNVLPVRSEERRVGKECRCAWSRSD